MRKINTILPRNIKFLRKRSNLSQAELADKLGVKRSNIAAYESKNVEPRLRIILAMAKFFDVNIETLITSVVEEMVEIRSFSADNKQLSAQENTYPIKDSELAEFVEKSMNIRKVLEGFKSFYGFKKDRMVERSDEQQKLISDIDNFIQLMDHLLSYNEAVVNALTNEKVQLETP